jgi:ribosomal protein S18 acetylase RimI-like enzyme
VPGTNDDAAAHALIEAAFAEIEGHRPEPLAAWTSRRDPALTLLAEEDGALRGAVVGERWAGGVGYVAQLAVAPAARRRAVGRALLLHLFARFRAAGLEHAELSVHAANARAAGLYASVGLRTVWRQERWEADLAG